MRETDCPSALLRAFAAIAALGGILFLASSCGVWGDLDNPADAKAANYQGYPSTEDFDKASQALSALGAGAIAKILLPEIIGASEYDMRIYSDAANPETSEVFRRSAATNAISLPQRYLAAASWLYQFRVRKAEGADWGPWSKASAIEVQAYLPAVSAPPDGGSTTDTTPTLSWTEGAGETAWVVQTALELSALDAATLSETASSSYEPATPIPFGSTLYWRVAPKAESGYRGWGKVNSISVSAWSYALDAVAPLSGATLTDTTPLLDWSDAEGAASYELQLAASEAGLGSSASMIAPSSSYAASAGLELGAWYWRVRAKNADGVAGPWSAIWSFTLKWDYTIAAASPTDTELIGDTTPLLDWSDVSGATGYEVQISTTSEGLATATPATSATSSYQVTTPYASGDTLHWRVRAKNADGVAGAWSSAWSFLVVLPVPIPSSPTDGLSIADSTPLLDWSDSEGASSYELQLADTAAGLPGSTVLSATTSQYQVATDLAMGLWYWRVAMKNADSVNGPWSSASSFTVTTQAGIGISQDPQLPIAVTLSGHTSLLPFGQDMTVSADTGQAMDSYAWYLDGLLIAGASAKTVTLGAALEAGNYRLTAKVAKGGVQGSAYIEFAVRDAGIPLTGLVAEYLFSGNAKDTSGNGYDGTVSGTELGTDRFDMNDNDYVFGNNAVKITLPSSAPVENEVMSFFCWIKISSNNYNTNYIYSKTHDSGYQSAFFQCDPSSLTLYFGVSSTAKATTTATCSLFDNSWHFIGFTRGAGSVSLIIDGSVVATGTYPSYYVKSSDYCQLGNYYNSFSNYSFRGSMDDVRFYSRVSTAEEISRLYHENGWGQ